MSKNKGSSGRWLKRQRGDKFVKQAQEEGYRSRAAFKLLELNKKYRCFRRGMIVVDLGAAPGGWTQVVTEIVGDQGHVYALDLLEMDQFANATFLQGDFTDPDIVKNLLSQVGDRKVGWVISDMAPNMSGNKSLDQSRSIDLVERALYFSGQVLSKGGGYLAKVFQGEGFEEFVKQVRVNFDTVKISKPDSSRAASRECYVIGLGYKDA